MNTKKKSYFVILVLTAGLLFAFNNCSPFEAETGEFSSSSQAVCDGQLKAAFQRTYHPFLKTNCNKCHSAAHGSRDLNTSYEAFMIRGETLIDYQSTNPHGGNNFSSAMQSQINVFKPNWTRSQIGYFDCLENAAAAGDSSNLRTVGKAIPSIIPTADNNNWVGIEWDLETEAEGLANGKFKAVLKVEVKLNKFNGEISGLFIRNPTVKLKSTVENISISGLMIYLDGVKQTAVTTYSGISKIINVTTPVNLVDASGAAYAIYKNFAVSTRLGFEIDEIKYTTAMPDDPDDPVVGPPILVEIPNVPIPTAGVTYSQLTSSTSPYRVMNRSCLNCHGGNATLNLTNYDIAKANTVKIIERMNSTTAPMPPTGRLRQNDRDMVQSWVNSGAPR